MHLPKIRLVPVLIVALIASWGVSFYFANNSWQFQGQSDELEQRLASASAQINSLMSEDQYQINKILQEEIKNINKTYLEAVSSYEQILDLKTQKQDTAKLDALYAKIVKFLSEKNYASASAILADLNKQIQEVKPKTAVVNLPQSNTPPTSGYSVQSATVDGKSFRVAMIAAELNSTKVIVDTASDSDCRDNCPVLPLADYVSRNGAYAGINGSYFCPAEYPSCAGKTGSFDTLLMNKNKHYFNSDNNVYSKVPAAIFSAGSARFVSQSLEWGRDTSVDTVIANYPLLVGGGNINFTEDTNEPKFGGAAARTFIANKDNMVYIGIVYGASMGESAKVLHAMGMQEALNLDQGGSTALWFGGYKAGPGRNIPNAILFVRR